MIVDGINIFDDLGLLVRDRGNSLQAAGVKLALGQSPFAHRRRLLGRQATDALKVTLRGSIITDNGLTPTAAKAQLQDRVDRLKWRLRQQDEHTLRWSDITDRFWDVEFQEIQVRGRDPDWIQLAKFIDIRTLAIDPRAQAEVETALDDPGALPRLNEVLPIGTAPQDGLITIVGNAAAPLLTNWDLEYRNAANTVINSFRWTGGSIIDTDTLTINLDTGVVELNGVNAVDDITVTAGSFPFEVDPDDGDFLSAVAADQPDLRLSGSGTVDTFEYRYRPRFW